MLVCRGCCCGTNDRHPDVDHVTHLATLRAAAASSTTNVWTVDCLGPCERSNVVVVRTGATRRWFGGLLTDDAIKVLAGWVGDGAPAPTPELLTAHEFTPDATPTMAAAALPLAPSVLADIVHQLLRDGRSSWTLGVHGAAAEFDGSDPERVVSRSGSSVVAITARAALRIDLGSARLYSVDKPGTREPIVMILAVGDEHTQPAHSSVTDLGPDRAAIRPEDRDTHWFDLGISRPAATFAVRATGPIEELLREQLGQPLDTTLAAIGDSLVAASPTRVVETPLGRVEVWAPIPTHDGTSPPGSHTHLLQGELDLALDLPPGIGLPAGVTPAAIIRPPAGWTYPMATCVEAEAR